MKPAPREPLTDMPIKGTAARLELVPDQIPPPPPPPDPVTIPATSPDMIVAPSPRANPATMNLRLPGDVHHELRKLAFQRDTSINRLIVDAVKAMLAGRPGR